MQTSTLYYVGIVDGPDFFGDPIDIARDVPTKSKARKIVAKKIRGLRARGFSVSTRQKGGEWEAKSVGNRDRTDALIFLSEVEVD